jgi:putative ABC transport system permease protein
VAAKLGLRAGDPFAPTHGADDGLVHDPFTVTGILARTDTPVDRGVYVNMEGFYLQEGHAKPVEGATAAKPAEPATGTPAPLPREQREVTAILVETVSLPGLPAELTAMALKTQINEGRDGQAAEPIREISVLLGLFVRPLELLLLLVTTLVVIVSAIGILVSMVGSSLERSRDVAVMRALGASRGQVLATVLIEAVILALGGGLAGWALGHVLVAAIGPLITTNAGVSATLLSAAPTAELLLVPFLIGLAILAALMPALAAYRTDVAKWLG